MRNVLVRVIVSLVAGTATVGLVHALTLFPYSAPRDAVSDVLSMPGAFVAGIFYPAGVHTGTGAPAWATMAFAGNLLFYASLWFVTLAIFQSRRRRTGARRLA